MTARARLNQQLKELLEAAEDADSRALCAALKILLEARNYGGRVNIQLIQAELHRAKEVSLQFEFDGLYSRDRVRL